jgi:hypothetical protein
MIETLALFDPSFTVGDIIVVAGILAGGGAFYARAQQALTVGQKNSDELAEMRRDMQKIATFQEKLADGKARMDRLDTDISRLRKDQHEAAVQVTGELAALRATIEAMNGKR